MAKAVAIYTILATAFLLLLHLSPAHRTQKGSHHIRLSRRLAEFKGPYFDPLITKMEQKVEDKGLNVNTVDYNMQDNQRLPNDQGYFGDDGKLNLTLRLKMLFPLIDNLPNDGYVGFRELEAWNIKQTKERLAYTTRKERDAHDKNNDGLISFNEYFPRFSHEDIKKNKMEHGEAGWWMKQFTNADADQDGFLSFEELRDFLHPEDSENAKVQEWSLREKIRRMDSDNDGKLNLQEFRDNAYDTFRSYYEFSTGEILPSPELLYQELDLNKDRLLTIQELKPIRHYLFPGELDYASYYTTYLMNEVDDNHDGMLTIEEILNHEEKFYKKVYVGDEEEEDFHDEF